MDLKYILEMFFKKADSLYGIYYFIEGSSQDLRDWSIGQLGISTTRELRLG